MKTAATWTRIGAALADDGTAHGGQLVALDSDGRIVDGSPSLRGRLVSLRWVRVRLSVAASRDAICDLDAQARRALAAGDEGTFCRLFDRARRLADRLRRQGYLTGRAQLADLDATEELGKRQQAQLESAWTRAAVRDQWRHAAACQGIAGADLDALAAELLQTSAAECAEHNRMLRDAREALDEHTGIHRAMVMSDRLAEDADSVSGIDEVSQDMENAYPLLRAGGRPADENLLSLLQQGNRKPIDLEQAYAAALDQLAACRDRDRAGAREPGDDSADDESAAPATSEPIPF